MGRNPKYELDEIIEVAKATRGVIADMASELGVQRLTVYNYINRHKEVADVVNQYPAVKRGPKSRFTPEQVRDALIAANGNVRQASKALGTSRETVYSYIRKHGMVHRAYLDTRE